MTAAWDAPPNKIRELTPQMEEFLDWLTGNRPEGENQAGFARRVGVTESTLSKWKRHEVFIAAWEKRMKEGAAHPSILTEQLRVLNEQALAGDVKSIELYWKLVDRMSPQRLEVSDTRDASELSDEELAQAAANVGVLKAV